MEQSRLDNTASILINTYYRSYLNEIKYIDTNKDGNRPTLHFDIT